MKRILTALLLMTPLTVAIGISPATIELSHTQNATSVTLVSDEPLNASLSVEGPLAGIIEQKKNVFVEGRRTVNLSFDKYDYPPGVTASTLHVTASKTADARIGARPGISAPIRVTAPRNGTYLEGRFLSTTLRSDRKGSIPFELTNRGNVSTEVTVTLDIANTTKEETITIHGLDTRTLGFPITLPAGEYDATVRFANRTVTKQFRVGDPATSLHNITVSGFNPLRLSATIRNEWNQERVISPVLQVQDRYPASATSIAGRETGLFTFQPDLDRGTYEAAIITEYSRHVFTLNITKNAVHIDDEIYERPGWNGWAIGAVLCALFLILMWRVTTRK